MSQEKEPSEISEETSQVSGSDVATPSGRRGPKADHDLWSFFTARKVADGTLFSFCNFCSYKNKGKQHTTLKMHLEKKHEDEYRKLKMSVKETAEKKAALLTMPKAAGPKMGLEMFGFGSKTPRAKYQKEHPVYQKLKSSLTVRAGCTSFPLNLVESAEFKVFVSCLDPRAAASLPSRWTLKNWVLKSESFMREKILMVMLESKKSISVCADLWSQKGLTYSYLGLTAHFYDQESKQLKSAALACTPLPHPHTAKRILEKIEEVLEMWQLCMEDVCRHVTDAGANIVCALKKQVVTQMVEQVPMVAPRADWNIESEDEEEDDDSPEACAEEYWKTEKVVKETFPRRISCYAHRMCNVCKTVMEADDCPVKELKEEVFKVIGRFGHSGACNEQLKQIAGKKLLKPSKTRWNSFFYVADRLIEIEDQFVNVCKENDIPISFSFSSLKVLHKLMKPFAEQTTFIEGQKYSTGSRVIPSILTLKEHLDDKDGEFSQRFGDICERLTAEIDRRFGSSLCLDSQDFDPTHLICTILDPEYSCDLSPMYFDAGKKELRKFFGSFGNIEESVHILEQAGAAAEVQPQPKGRKKRRQFGMGPQLHQENQLTSQIDGFNSLQESGSFKEGINPFEFWESEKIRFSCLFNAAVAMLAIPGTSAPVERLFSQAGLSSSGQRHNVTPKLVEAEAILKYNKNEWECFSQLPD